MVVEQHERVRCLVQRVHGVVVVCYYGGDAFVGWIGVGVQEWCIFEVGVGVGFV